MAIAIRGRTDTTRRQFLRRVAAAGTLAGAGTFAKPYLSRAADRPALTCGLQSGDVSIDSAMVWARTDRPARMHAEFSTVESLNTIFRTMTLDALPDTDFTAKLLVDHLPSGQNIFYRVRFDDLSPILPFLEKRRSDTSAPRLPIAARYHLWRGQAILPGGAGALTPRLVG